MYKINAAYVSKYRNAEYLHFFTNVIDVYRRMETKQPLLEKRIEELEKLIAIMNTSFRNQKAESFTAQLKPLDELRIDTVKGLKRFLQSESYRPDMKKREHAGILLKSLKKICSGIERFSYQHKTGLIRTLLTSWSSKPNFIKAIAEIHGNSWMEDLQAQNDSFYEHFMEKARAITSSPNSKTIRASIKIVYDELLVDTLSLARVFADNEEVISLIHTMNGLVHSANAPVFTRSSRKKKDVPALSVIPA